MPGYQDLDEELGYDADHEDRRQYCPHGTFIGSWWGPDYLCGWCEDGISPEEMTKAVIATAARARHRRCQELTQMLDTVNSSLRPFPFNGAYATSITTFVSDEIDRWHLTMEDIG